MDLTTGWDFNIESHRSEAERYIDENKPLVVIGSPPCTPFSQLQAFSPASENKERKWREGVRHMEFVVKLYRKQLEAGRIFVHENPAHATSWALPAIRKMGRLSGRTFVVFVCQAHSVRALGRSL